VIVLIDQFYKRFVSQDEQVGALSSQKGEKDSDLGHSKKSGLKMNEGIDL